MTEAQVILNEKYASKCGGIVNKQSINNTFTFIHDSWFPKQDLKLGPPEHEAEEPTTLQQLLLPY
jgi:hypothetical protein